MLVGKNKRRLFCYFKSLLICFSCHQAIFASQLVENEKTVLKNTISYLIDNKKMGEAKEITKRYIATHSSDGEIYRIDGLVNYLDKDYSNAIRSFNKAAALTVDEQQAINLYLLAKSQAKAQLYSDVNPTLDRMDEIPGADAYVQNARDQFNRDKTLPEFNVALLIVQNPTLSLKKTKEVEKTEKNYALLSEGVFGYDSNPIYVQDSSPTRNDANSTFYSVKVGGSYKINPSIGLMNNKLSVGYTAYQKELAKAFNNFTIVYQVNWKPSWRLLSDQKISLKYQATRSYAAPKKLKYYFTGHSLDLNKEFEDFGKNKFNVSLLTGYRIYGNQDLDSKENDRSGFSYGIKGGHKYQGDDAWAWLNTLAYNVQNTVGKKFNTQGVDFLTDVQKILPWDFEGLFGFNYGLLTYTNFPDKRTDESLGFSLELSHDVIWIKGLESALSFSAIKNHSNAEESTFSQNVILLRISYEG